MSVLWLLPALELLDYLIVRYAETIDSAPRGLLLALDHSTFVGILTNAIPELLVATAGRRPTWAWADHIVFWGMNIGLAGFVIGLVAEAVAIKRAPLRSWALRSSWGPRPPPCACERPVPWKPSSLGDRSPA
jgi:hypothetical protein